MHIFYTPDLSQDTYTLNEQESKHAVRVLRLTTGEKVLLVNGAGTLYHAEVTHPNPKHCGLLINEKEENYHRRPYRLHMAVAPTKNIDRFEWFLEKATEIGLDEITPILSHHSERKVIKPERLEKVIVAAMKQSIKAFKPKLNPLTTFKKFVEAQQGKWAIAHCYEMHKTPFKEFCAAHETLSIMIGPEGDFSQQEVALALSKGAQPVSLGGSRLRTETAAIAACHTMNLMRT